MMPSGTGQMTIGIGRRQFLSAFGGAAAVWPFAACAQQPAPGKWRIGLLMQKSRQDPFLKGLRELGYVEGSNLVVEARPIDRADRLAEFAAELVGLNRMRLSLPELRRPRPLNRQRTASRLLWVPVILSITILWRVLLIREATRPVLVCCRRN